MTYSFSYLEPVCCYMSSSNCCFLTCIQIFQEAGQVVWYSYLFQNFPVYCDPHSQRLWHRNKFIWALIFPRPVCAAFFLHVLCIFLLYRSASPTSKISFLPKFISLSHGLHHWRAIDCLFLLKSFREGLRTGSW